MAEKTYLVHFKSDALESQLIIAATAEIQDEHLVLLDAKGKLTALFLMEIVEGWSELPIPE
jgi:hypothetical protein